MATAGADRTASNGLEARYTTADRAGTVTLTAPSRPLRIALEVPYTGWKVALEVPAVKDADAAELELFTATRYSRGAPLVESIRERANTPAPSAA
jgi:hypothetical protein